VSRVTEDEWLKLLSRAANMPDGLCGERREHYAHIHDSASLGRFWCHADQSRRLPAAAERAWRPHGKIKGATPIGVYIDEVHG